jgi:guanylate kinase
VSIDKQGILFIVSSPSGGGKTTLIRETIDRLAEYDIIGHFSISHTTRPARPAETDGVDYHFVDDETFESMVQRGDFLEWAKYADYLYGTSRGAVEEQLTAGCDVFLDIEVQGANQVKTLMPDVRASKSDARTHPRRYKGGCSGLYASFRSLESLIMLLSTTVSGRL